MQAELASWAWIKAELICQGSIQSLDPIPESAISSSSAGPDSGSNSICLGFGPSGIRMVLSNSPQDYQLKLDGDCWSILKLGSRLISKLKLLPKLAHTYNQIFLNLDSRCIYDCKFCNLKSSRPKFDQRSLLKFVEQHPGFPIALTSGIWRDEAQTTQRMLRLIKQLRKITDQPIGVEHLATDPSQLEQLYSAGADELKLNLSFAQSELFQRFCPGLDQARILAALRNSTQIFGKNKVCSNLFLGAGESPGQLIRAMQMLAEWGVVPNLRLLRINPGRRAELERILQSYPKFRQPWYLIGMGIAQKRILHKSGLDPRKFSTMCFSCKLCDLIPFVDL